MTPTQTAINHKLDVLETLPNDRERMLDWLHERTHAMSDCRLADLIEQLASADEIERLWHALACDEATESEEGR